MKSMFIEIKTLTPIWTGGVKGSCDILRETGIIGSMRWWYEAIVRGLGGDACDPTGHVCSYKRKYLFSWNDVTGSGEEKLRQNLKKHFGIGWVENSDIVKSDDNKTILISKDNNSAEIVIDENNKKVTLKLSDGRCRNLIFEMEDGKLNIYDCGICDVCRLFGVTGWKRRFNLTIIDNNTRPAWKGEGFNVRPPDRSHGWFLSAGMVGSFRLKIRGEPDAVSRIASLFIFLEKWGAIGAKSQLGYGFFEIINHNEIQEYAMDWSEICTQVDLSGLPDLRQFTFFKYRFKPSRDDWWTRIKGLQRLLGEPKTASKLSELAKIGIIPVSPVLKNQWRYVEWSAPSLTKRWIFGTSDQEKRRGKISISWAYREKDMWVVRGWAWLPEEERIKSRTIQHRQEIGVVVNMFKNELVWKKALNLDNNSRTNLYVERLTNTDTNNVINFIRGKT